jgi:hypothetical protein
MEWRLMAAPVSAQALTANRLTVLMPDTQPSRPV